MTAVETAVAPTGLGRSRIGAVVRMHLSTPFMALGLPMLITLAVLTLNYLIWQLILLANPTLPQADPDAFIYNGGAVWIAFYLLSIAIQTMNATFRYALGMSVTRRDYLLGTGAFMLILSVVFVALYAVLGVIERATDGWGVNGWMISGFGMMDLPLWKVLLIWMGAMLIGMGLGVFYGAVFVQWRTTGVLITSILIAGAILAGVWVLTETQGWADLIELVVTATAWETAIAIVAATGLAFGVTYLLMRRAPVRE